MRTLLPPDVTSRPQRRRSWLTRTKPLRVAQRAVLAARYSYPTRNLLLIGQPKSGTTWLRRILCSLPGYLSWTPPTTEWWNDHPLDPKHFLPPPIGYTITRVHSGPTPEHVALVRDAGRPFVVVLRDLRDVAVSWAHFVDTNHFGAPDRLKALDIPARLDAFIDELLPAYAEWAVGWLDADLGDLRRTVWYEDLVADTPAELAGVLRHFRIELPEGQVRALADRHSFKRETGRSPGQQDTKSFNRKGVAGDWRNHFDDARLARFIGSVGDRAHSLRLVDP